jgi:hypothetical protein
MKYRVVSSIIVLIGGGQAKTLDKTARKKVEFANNNFKTNNIYDIFPSVSVIMEIGWLAKEYEIE